MASGKETGAESVKKFMDWQIGKTDADYKEYVYQNKMLNQSAIARELNFGRKAFKENEVLFTALETLEKRLRKEKVILKEKLKPENLPEHDRNKVQLNRDKQRLNQLEQQNAALRAQVFNLKAKLKELNIIDEFITETGRMPR